MSEHVLDRWLTCPCPCGYFAALERRSFRHRQASPMAWRQVGGELQAAVEAVLAERSRRRTRRGSPPHNVSTWPSAALAATLCRPSRRKRRRGGCPSSLPSLVTLASPRRGRRAAAGLALVTTAVSAAARPAAGAHQLPDFRVVSPHEQVPFLRAVNFSGGRDIGTGAPLHL